MKGKRNEEKISTKKCQGIKLGKQIQLKKKHPKQNKQ
jgi:hypothetical protein